VTEPRHDAPAPIEPDSQREGTPEAPDPAGGARQAEVPPGEPEGSPAPSPPPPPAASPPPPPAGLAASGVGGLVDSLVSLLPEDRPEVGVGLAFAAGFLAARILKRLARH